MNVLAALIWIAIGIFYIMHKGFVEVVGIPILSILCIALCVAGFFIVAAVTRYSDSTTAFFLTAVGLIELLALALTKASDEYNKSDLCQAIACIFLPFVLFLGIIEMLTDEKYWLLLIIIPAALYLFVKIRDNAVANKSKTDSTQQLEEEGEESSPNITDEQRRAIEFEVSREFPTQEQVRDIINRYQLPRYFSQYSFEVYSRWREEEVQRRMRSVEHKEADHDHQ